MVKILNYSKFVDMCPLFATLLIEGANIGQLHRMWSYHTAAGQSLIAWCCVFIALFLWCLFYKKHNIHQKLAIWSTYIGMGMNASVIATIIRWRYF